MIACVALVQRVVAEVGAILDDILKPPIVPRPMHGRRGNSEHERVLDAQPNFWFSAAAIARPLRSAVCALRTVQPKNTMPAFGASLKPLMRKPGNATAFSHARLLAARSRDIRRMTASVRSSEARVRQLREGDEVLLVLRGHETGRHLVEARSTASRPGRRRRPAR